MIFSSFNFILFFLPFVVIIFHFLKYYISGKIALSFVTLSSFFFYSQWNPVFIFLLLFSILGNYLFNILLIKKPRKFILYISIFLNLLVLGYFKYRYFIAENLSLIIDNNIEIKSIIIPLGISFFTFQQIALLIDTFQKKFKCKSFLEFSFFVSFFPQLIAGPIVLFEDVRKEIKKITNNQKFLFEKINIGFCIFAIGLFKKVVIADTISLFVNKGYSVVSKLTFIEAWLLTIGYFFQIYFDFSGYSDMAIGIGLMFGLLLPLNFNNPYFATSMIEYWKRWHITMTRFFMTYIYSPLVFNLTRFFAYKTGSNFLFLSVALSILITFFLSGLWHGASWKFVMFGLINAFGLIINHYWKQNNFYCNKIVGWLLTMITVLISLIFFRAANIDEAITIIELMFSFEQQVFPQFLLKFSNFFNVEFSYLAFLSTGQDTVNYLLILVFAFLATYFLPNYANKINELKLNWKISLFISLIFIISLTILDRPQSFIYFEF